MSTASTFGSGNGATAPGAEAGRVLDLLRLRDARRRRVDCPRDLGGVAAPIARHERDDRPLVADEDERLHDLAEVAADGVGGVLR